MKLQRRTEVLLMSTSQVRRERMNGREVIRFSTKKGTKKEE